MKNRKLSLEFTKTEDGEKVLSGLVSVLVGLESGINNMKRWVYATLYQQFTLLEVQ